MNNLKSALTISLLAICANSADAKDFFDTSSPDKTFSLGARIGLNCSNQTHNKDFTKLNLDKWGTGFDAGVICDINFKNFISVQPGFFFESRSHDYAYIYNYLPTENLEYGHTRFYSFTVPVLASLKLYPADFIRWSIDLGPYFQFGISGSDKGVSNSIDFKDGYFDNRKKCDVGLKLGTGVTLFDHYYLGIHYSTGFNNVYKDLYGGHHKAWTMTIGYDF